MIRARAFALPAGCTAAAGAPLRSVHPAVASRLLELARLVHAPSSASSSVAAAPSVTLRQVPVRFRAGRAFACAATSRAGGGGAASAMLRGSVVACYVSPRASVGAAVSPNAVPAAAMIAAANATSARALFGRGKSKDAAASSPATATPDAAATAGAEGKATTKASAASGGNAIQGVYSIKHRTAEDEERDRKQQEEQQQAEDDSAGGGGHNAGYLPFPEPFHTVNIMAILLLGNVLMYFVMRSSSDATRDWIVEHFTLSHENWWRVYPLLTHSLYQENFMQLAIDVWLLMQFGRTQLGFLGNTRLTFFWALCTLGAAAIHVTRQKVMLYYEMDPIEVRGRVFGPNPFILGLVGLEGLIFRNMNFLQNPPVPFLVLTAGVMIIDVWRIFTMKPEEHGASTGGALLAYIMWALPTRMLGLDRLTAAV
jgi:membrane associated rhomboid family serine protease